MCGSALVKLGWCQKRGFHSSKTMPTLKAANDVDEANRTIIKEAISFVMNWNLGEGLVRVKHRVIFQPARFGFPVECHWWQLWATSVFATLQSL